MLYPCFLSPPLAFIPSFPPSPVYQSYPLSLFFFSPLPTTPSSTPIFTCFLLPRLPRDDLLLSLFRGRLAGLYSVGAVYVHFSDDLWLTAPVPVSLSVIVRAGARWDPVGNREHHACLLSLSSPPRRLSSFYMHLQSQSFHQVPSCLPWFMQKEKYLMSFRINLFYFHLSSPLLSLPSPPPSPSQGTVILSLSYSTEFSALVGLYWRKMYLLCRSGLTIFNLPSH